MITPQAFTGIFLLMAGMLSIAYLMFRNARIVIGQVACTFAMLFLIVAFIVVVASGVVA